MSINSDNLRKRDEQAVRHSALEEFQRDERRPALMLLSMLVIAAIFFAIGILVGRWTATSVNTQSRAAHSFNQ